MSRIRRLERQDLPAVADLYEVVARSRTPHAPPGLASYFERLVCDQPYADPEIPSLVYDEPGTGIVGFIASYPRRFVYGDRPLRLACSGQLVAHPDFRSRGVGALLMRSYLRGPQDLTFTDGASDASRLIWERLGGVTNAAASIRWTRVLAPSRYYADVVAHRGGRSHAPGARLWMALDGIVGRNRRSGASTASTRRFDAAAMIEGIEGLARAFPLRPVYDIAFLHWLFREMEVLEAASGKLVRRVVTRADGTTAGWFIAYVPPRGIAQAIHVAGEDVGIVLDSLFSHAAELQATAVQGRVDPYLYPALCSRRCWFMPTSWVLVHTRDPALLGVINTGRALLTRLDGECWMGHHRVDADMLARPPAQPVAASAPTTPVPVTSRP